MKWRSETMREGALGRSRMLGGERVIRVWCGVEPNWV